MKPIQNIKKVTALLCLACLMAGCSNLEDNNSSSSQPEATQQTTTAPATIAETPAAQAAKPAKTVEMTTTAPPETTTAQPPASPAPLKPSLSNPEIAALDNTEQGYGQGVQFNEKNQPLGALWFNDSYEQYDAYAIIEDESKAKNIYLTFDQGYENGYTSVILDTLKEKGAKATFFITGDYMRYADPALIQRMVDEGHTLGVHGDRHKSIAALLNQSEEDAAKELNSVRDALKEKYNVDCIYSRPPEGLFSAQSLAFTQSIGYKSFLWSFAYKDWEVNNQPDPEAAFQKITEHPHGGEIMLLHSVSSTNAQILGRVIDKLQADGYQLVGLDV